MELTSSEFGKILMGKDDVLGPGDLKESEVTLKLYYTNKDIVIEALYALSCCKYPSRMDAQSVAYNIGLSEKQTKGALHHLATEHFVMRTQDGCYYMNPDVYRTIGKIFFEGSPTPEEAEAREKPSESKAFHDFSRPEQVKALEALAKDLKKDLKVEELLRALINTAEFSAIVDYLSGDKDEGS